MLLHIIWFWVSIALGIFGILMVFMGIKKIGKDINQILIFKEAEKSFQMWQELASLIIYWIVAIFFVSLLF
jgi:hypothetical protein